MRRPAFRARSTVVAVKPVSNPLPDEVFVIRLVEVLGVISDRGRTQTNGLEDAFADGLVEVGLSISLVELVENRVYALPSGAEVVRFGHA